MHRGQGSTVYVTYGTLAGKAGMTVNELKRALRSKGYLRGNEVTEKALRYRVAEMQPVTRSTRISVRMKDVYVVWDMIRVLRMLKRSGLTRDPRGLTVSREQYVKRMSEISIELARHVSGEKPKCALMAVDMLRGKVGEHSIAIFTDTAYDFGIDLRWNLDAVISGEINRFTITRQVIEAFGAVAYVRPEPGRHLAMAESIHVGMEAFIDRRIAKVRPTSFKKKERNA
jgi:hypothetical protein